MESLSTDGHIGGHHFWSEGGANSLSFGRARSAGGSHAGGGGLQPFVDRDGGAHRSATSPQQAAGNSGGGSSSSYDPKDHNGPGRQATPEAPLHSTDGSQREWAAVEERPQTAPHPRVAAPRDASTLVTTSASASGTGGAERSESSMWPTHSRPPPFAVANEEGAAAAHGLSRETRRAETTAAHQQQLQSLAAAAREDAARAAHDFHASTLQARASGESTLTSVGSDGGVPGGPRAFSFRASSYDRGSARYEVQSCCSYCLFQCFRRVRDICAVCGHFSTSQMRTVLSHSGPCHFYARL